MWWVYFDNTKWHHSIYDFDVESFNWKHGYGSLKIKDKVLEKDTKKIPHTKEEYSRFKCQIFLSISQ